MIESFSQSIFTDAFRLKAEKVHVDFLKLPTRAKKFVNERDIKNSYDAILVLYEDFQFVKGIGNKTISQTETAISEFVSLIEVSTGGELAELSDPRDIIFSGSDKSFARLFPEIIDHYLRRVARNNFARNRDVLVKRFGLNGESSYTLQDIGTFYDITRERVRQIEAKIIRDIGLLLNGKLKTKSWTVAEPYCNSYINLFEAIDNSGLIVTRSNLVTLIDEILGDSFHQGYLELLMETYGYIKLPQKVDNFRGVICEAWCRKDKAILKSLEAIYKGLDNLYQSPLPMSLFDITVAAKKQSRTKIANKHLTIALSSLEDIEPNGDAYQVKISSLKSAADKAFRVLYGLGEPVHYSKILSEINHQTSGELSQTTTNLTNQLVADDRFTPMGKSGVWSLASWGDSSALTILEAIKRVLHESGKPLAIDVIFDKVGELRADAAKSSIRVYLNDKSHFTRVSRSTFGVLEWRLEPARESQRRNKFPEKLFRKMLIKVLEDQNPIPFPKAISKVMELTSLSHQSVRQKILKIEGLKLKRAKTGPSKILFCPDIAQLMTPDDTENKVTLRVKVQSEIRSVLSENLNSPMTKGALYKKITENMDCIRPTFYSYLSEMKDIKQFVENGRSYVLSTPKNEVKLVNVDLAKHQPSTELRNSLDRALSKLTIDEIDIGLFELGLHFETILKAYILKEKELGIYTVYTRDTSKLVNMIDFVVREKIITKGHHLTTLREERNNRAHGNIPSLEERKDLFYRAHYIANLFVKYICWFDNALRRL